MDRLRVGNSLRADRVCGFRALNHAPGCSSAFDHRRSIGPVFRSLHNFNNGETGLVFITFLYAVSNSLDILSLISCIYSKTRKYFWVNHQPLRSGTSLPVRQRTSPNALVLHSVLMQLCRLTESTMRNAGLKHVFTLLWVQDSV